MDQLKPSIRVIVFAKAPVPGLCKTRLIPALGAHGAAGLALRMLNHSVNNALEARLGPVELCASPFEHEIWAALHLPQSVVLTDQGTGDLGERMARACARCLASFEPVILMGTDCPACDAPYLRAMACAMQTRDAVIAAATDGGYPAIGLTRLDDSIFRGITWSTNTVLTETTQRMSALGWNYLVSAELHDIDEPEDLQYLPGDWQCGES